MTFTRSFLLSPSPLLHDISESKFGKPISPPHYLYSSAIRKRRDSVQAILGSIFRSGEPMEVPYLRHQPSIPDGFGIWNWSHRVCLWRVTAALGSLLGTTETEHRVCSNLFPFNSTRYQWTGTIIISSYDGIRNTEHTLKGSVAQKSNMPKPILPNNDHCV